jgi:glucose-6-phosphate 1-dehydrogenase
VRVAPNPGGRELATMSAIVEPLVREDSDLASENPLVEGLERLPVRPTTLVMFGGTGDLAHRKLLPALYNLAHDGALPERFRLVGVARADHPHEDFRQIARESIMRFSRREPDPDVLDGLIADLRYVPGTFDDDAVYAELGRTLDEFDDQAPGKLDRVSTCRRHRDSSRRSPASWRQRDCTASSTRIRGS